MNARTTEHLVFVPSTMSIATPAVQHKTNTSRPSGLEALAMRALNWLINWPRRHAVINELQRLTDRELSDIGLNRSEIAAVFSRGR